jgi:hypothetical protein
MDVPAILIHIKQPPRASPGRGKLEHNLRLIFTL